MKKVCIIFLAILSSCTSKYVVFQNDSSHLASISFIDQNGLSETISAPDRLRQYEKVDFLSHQPYEKVLRVYTRNKTGDTTAYVTTYHENGLPKQYLEVVNNRAYGTYREWFPEGHLKLEASIIGGEADINTAAEKTWLFDGIARVWDENNNLFATIPYQKGVLNGPSLYYHPSGEIWKRIPYNKNRICGTLETFYSTGKTLQTMDYVEGKLHGKGMRLWNDGSIAADETYMHGQLIEGYYFDCEKNLISEVVKGYGKRAVFSKNRVCELQEFTNGTFEGEVRTFSDDGHLVRIYHIKNDKKNGEEIEYYPHNPYHHESRPMLSITWSDGKIHGICKTWYENESLESQREISNNLKTGLSTAWYRDGSLMMIEEYDQDKLVKGDYFKMGEKHPVSDVMLGSGIATLYDSDGNFLKRITYLNGLPDEV